jgi:hypothetical protein
MLAAGPGSLAYIRSYGFKTFAPWIDESYDQETDSALRLERIIKSMKQIQQLHGQELDNFCKEIKQIAEFNKKHFFSDDFFNFVRDELKNNLVLAHKQVTKTPGKYFQEITKMLEDHNLIDQWPQGQQKIHFFKQLQQSC